MNRLTRILIMAAALILLAAGSAMSLTLGTSYGGEPAALLLLGSGLIGLAGFRRRFGR